MATVGYTSQEDVGSNDGSVLTFSWTPLTSTNTDGAPIRSTQWADRYFTATGTWGGATLSIEGSNDGTNWFTLSNAAGGTAATFTANGGKSIIEIPQFIRPNLSTAGTGASITVLLTARRVNPMRT